MPPSVLLIGLSWESIPDPEIREYVRTGLEQTEKDMLAAGYDYKGFFSHPDESGVQPFIDVIKSHEWNLVIIGAGVRGEAKYTVFFETLVNEIRDKVPKAKLGFNWGPETTIESAKRLVPI